jgi:hypothetical protein
MCLRGRRKLEVCGLAVVTKVGVVPLAVTGQSVTVRSLGQPGALYMYAPAAGMMIDSVVLAGGRGG